MDPAELTTIGETGLRVTRMGMGTGPLGKHRDDEVWRSIFGTAWDAGIRLYDTSPFYGFGNSEQRLGRMLARKAGEEYTLSTKVGRLLRRDGPVEPFAQQYFYPEGIPADIPKGVYDYSRDGTLQSLEESRWRLGRERFDIVYVHDIIELSSGVNHVQEVVEGALPALMEQKAQGNVRAVGIGVQVNELLSELASRFHLDVCLLAGRYTLLDQSALEPALRICQERGTRIVVGSPYNTGILHSPGPDSTFDFVPAPPGLIEKALRIKAVCDRHGVPLPAAAIQFPFGHPAIISVLTGAENARELAENLAMMQVEIPEALWHELQDSGLIDPRAPLPCERAASADGS